MKRGNEPYLMTLDQTTMVLCISDDLTTDQILDLAESISHSETAAGWHIVRPPDGSNGISCPDDPIDSHDRIGFVHVTLEK